MLGGAFAAAATLSLAVSCSRSQDASLATDPDAATATSAARSRPPVAPLTAAPQDGAAADEAARGIMGGSAGAQNEMRQQKAVSEAFAASGNAVATPPPPAGMPSSSVIAAQPSSATSMLIRNGYAGIEVDSLDPAIERVRALAQRVGGFIANTTVQGGRNELRSASLEVKVPAARFDEAISGLAPIGKVESVNISAEDVGEQFVDVSARVENARRLEARLIALLANRTGKLQEVLSVERELARVREEIERYEGRLRFLTARVATSTLTINVHERAPIIVPVAGNGPIEVAFREAWRNFVGFIAALIASLGVLIPLGALVFVAWLGVRRWVPWRPAGGSPPAAGAVSGD